MRFSSITLLPKSETLQGTPQNEKGTMTKNIKTVEKEITEKIVASLEDAIQNGKASEWKLPWVSGGSGLPLSFSTGKPYRGGNLFILLMAQVENGFDSNYWITRRQLLQAGGWIREDQFKNSQTCYFFKEHEVRDKKTGNLKKVWFAKTYQVWNLSQSNISHHKTETPQSSETEDQHQDLSRFLHGGSADVRHGKTKAFYHPKDDYIGLPDPEKFFSEGQYLATRAHELVHWTGHESRLKRGFDNTNKEAYAFEELVAEVGSSFISAEFNLPYSVQADHEQYLLSWISALKNDTSAIFKAAKKASQAVDFLKKDAAAARTETEKIAA